MQETSDRTISLCDYAYCSIRRTIGNECCLSSVSWFSHSDAIKVATSLLSLGTSKCFPPGVRSSRLSRVTANAPSRSSMPTVFQKRFNVASAPDGRATQHTAHKPSSQTAALRFVAVTAGPEVATCANLLGLRGRRCDAARLHDEVRSGASERARRPACMDGGSV